MATLTTAQFGSSSCPQVQLVVTQSSSTATTATLSWTLKWVTHGYTVNSSLSKAYEVKINGSTVKTGSFAIGGKTSQNIASGSVSEIVGGTLDNDTSYVFTIQIVDTKNGTTSVKKTLGATKYPIDFKMGGTGVAFGKPAELNDVADIGYKTKFSGGILQPVLANGTDLNSVLTPNIYSGNNAKDNTYTNVPFTSGTFTLRVESAGPSGQIKQTITLCDKSKARTWERFYYSSAWGDWTCISDFPGTILWSGGYYMTSGHTINLSENISDQPSGVVLVFSEYYDGEVKNQTFVSNFVSKKLVSEHGGSGHSFRMCTSNLAYFATKYLYISDNKIVGHDNNNLVGTGTCGIKYTNNRFVLRYVIGV